MVTGLMTAADLARSLNKTTAVLANWRYMGTGPAFVKIGKSVRYRESDVEAWLQAQTRTQSGIVAR